MAGLESKGAAPPVHIDHTRPIEISDSVKTVNRFRGGGRLAEVSPYLRFLTSQPTMYQGITTHTAMPTPKKKRCQLYIR